MKTYRDAINQGYFIAEFKLQRGYISRKTETDLLPVLEGKGNRKGQFYVLIPNQDSTRYCWRGYLAKKEN